MKVFPEVEGVGETDANEDDMEEDSLIVEEENNENSMEEEFLVKKGVVVEEVDPIKKDTSVEKEIIVPVETNNPNIPEPLNAMDVPVNDNRVEEATARTGKKIRRPDRLVEKCTVALSDIGYGTLLGLLSGHEYAEREICAVGAGTTS